MLQAWKGHVAAYLKQQQQQQQQSQSPSQRSSNVGADSSFHSSLSSHFTNSRNSSRHARGGLSPCATTKSNGCAVMGNIQSGDYASCTSGLESTKVDILTPVTSREELQEYVRSQALLEQATSVEEASRAVNRTPSSHQGASKRSNSSSSRRSWRSPTSRSRTTTSQRKLNLKGVRHKGQKLMDKLGNALHSAGHAVGNRIHAVEEFMFPHTPQLGGSHTAATTSRQRSSLTIVPNIRGGVLLRGCLTDDEHREMARDVVEQLKPLHGIEGLRAIGFEYRLVPLDYNNQVTSNCDDSSPEGNGPSLTSQDGKQATKPANSTKWESHVSFQPGMEYDVTEMATKLFHADSNTMLTQRNRKEFIADGDMYDEVARLVQEYAQEVMIAEGNLEWVTLSEAGNNPEPIRALVSTSLSKDDAHLDQHPTLLVATGKGKVRAGIFSRQHLLLSGMECSTSVPLVREAKKRGMNIIMLDPNVHGDRLGMITFEKSMARLFRRWEKDETAPSDRPPLAQRDLFVLSHSQSGAQFARYLLDKSEHYVPHIRAVAFTDSTHNIQWAKEKKDLHQLLESENCVYFRCSKESSNESMGELPSAGTKIDTDSFWQHRFGRINTRCAGTTEHALTNWFARQHIWQHFDSFLHGKASTANS